MFHRGAERIVLSQLHDGIGRSPPGMRICEPDRLHRTEAQGLATALGHHLDRQAALEVGRGGFPVLELVFSPAISAARKASYCVLAHRAVDVVGARAAGPALS